MKSAVLLAAALTSALQNQPRVSLDCSAFKRLPDGAWVGVRTTLVTITNPERQTQFTFAAHEGTRYPTGAKHTPPAKADAFSDLVGEMMKGVDIVGELNTRCR